MKIIGQKILMDQLYNYTLSNLPKAMLLIGEQGCGKKTVAKELAQHLGVRHLIITDDISTDDIIEFNQVAVKTIYIIDLIHFNEKDQNQFLKFIEEPAENVHIILTARSEANILPTILNRCIKYRFTPYTVDDLKNFAGTLNETPDYFFKICKTPGQLINMDLTQFKAMYELSTKIVKYLDKASLENTVGIYNRINYAEEYNKYDMDSFLNILEYVAFDSFLKENNEQAFKIYKSINTSKSNMANKNLVKDSYMLYTLFQLWKVVR